MALLRASLPSTLGWLGLAPPHLNLRVLTASEAVVGATILLVGILPALRSSARPSAESMRAGQGATASREAKRRPGILITVEIAGALALITMAMLLSDTARRLDDVDLG